MAKRRQTTTRRPAERDFKSLLATDLKTGELRPVYVLEGADQLRIEQVAGFIRNKVLPAGGMAFNDHVLDAETSGWAQILQQARSFSLFGGRQVVWARHADLLKPREKDPHEAALVKYFQDPVETTILILSGRQFDARRAWLKAAKQLGYHVAFPAPRGEDLLAWIRKAAQKSGLTLSETAVKLLADLIGSDLQAMQGELDKLALLEQARGRPLTLRELPELILEQAELDAFSLTDATGPGHGTAMLKNWQTQLEQGRSVEELLPALVTHLRRAVLVACCLEDNHSLLQLPEISGLNAWLVKNKLAPLARILDPASCRLIIGACLACEQALKSSPLPSEVVGERLLAQLCTFENS